MQFTIEDNETKISSEAIKALEAVGVAEAINEIGALLRSSDGLKKHGEQGWRMLTRFSLIKKLRGHAPSMMARGRLEIDPDSKRLAVAHCAVRALMVTQRELEERAENRP